MSQVQEPSYYEIALTNRQVVVAFVILLACLVAAFLSGIWVGRDEAPMVAATVADAEPVAEASAPQESPDRLSFFEREAEAEAGAVQPQAGTTLQQDLAADRGRAPAAAQVTPPAPRPVEPQVSAPPRQEPAQSAPPKASPPKASPPPRSAVPPVTRASSGRTVMEPSVNPGGLMVQVFSSADQAQAQKVADRLIRGGRDAFLSPVEVDGQVMYRVRIGPFEARDAAAKVADQVRRDFRLDTWITQ
ncbi:MAG: SPOR domain-containing protein [Acidobacteriota bacterium]